MRSSKSRSRNKSNRQRTLGNIVNRVFDSSGPEGKVRGTPQQIIDKYLTLARDAQLSNDRVAEQSFLQHAEHYTRLLGEAQREQAERQQQYQSRQGDQNGQPGDAEHGNGNGQHAPQHAENGQGSQAHADPLMAEPEPRSHTREGGRSTREKPRDDKRDDQPVLVLEPQAAAPLAAVPAPAPAPLEAPMPTTETRDEDEDSGPIATPEAEEPARKPRRPRAPRKPKAAAPEE